MFILLAKNVNGYKSVGGNLGIEMTLVLTQYPH